MGRPPIHGLGDSGDPLYGAWVQLRTRCNNPNHKDYKNYGGRGIKVCARWDSFLAFAEDMGPHPGPSRTLDRRNTNGDYTKSNCRWATKKTQTRTRRITKLSQRRAEQIRSEYVPGKVTQYMLARKFGVSQQWVSRILHGHFWNA
jgi:hypothetical protein